ncbi:XTP/dITP diphosphatase [Weissella cibaria]|uniref:XTP/dITP diphosphatase n=1 Tax=Weissella cibaria TaxID=137591 RepID=UPI0021B031ED|nr:XTP/dITP diphosphatase [Weissella cibaria]MCT0958006.1 XTP/dITP diphosphatase [Weissella cibaria]
MAKLIFASKNEGKVREFREFLTPLGVEVVSLNELENVPTIIEDGNTFQENATIKAETIAKAFNVPVVAEDAGLTVDALDGAPGVHSARYAGDHDDAANNAKLLRELADVADADRTASFHAVIVAIKPDGKRLVASGKVNGRILRAAQGSDGFGYDPLFFYEPFGKSFGELTPAEKNEISHRGAALQHFMSDFNAWWED